MSTNSEWMTLREASAMAGFNKEAYYPIKIPQLKKAMFSDRDRSPYGLLHIIGVYTEKYSISGDEINEDYYDLDTSLICTDDCIVMGDILVLRSSVIEQRIVPKCPELDFKSAKETVFIPGHFYLIADKDIAGTAPVNTYQAVNHQPPPHPESALYAYLGAPKKQEEAA